MPYRSSFLRLDELKTAREDDEFERNLQNSRQFAQAPLTLDKMLKENEDRANKIKQQQRDNEYKDAELLEKGMHNDALESVAKQNAETGAVNAGTGKGNLDLKTNKFSTKEGKDNLMQIVAGRLATNPEALDEDVIKSISAQPGMEGYNEDQVAYALSEARRKAAESKSKLDLDSAREDSTRAQANLYRKKYNAVAKAATPKEQKATAGERGKIAAAKADVARMDALLDDISEAENSQTGVVSVIENAVGKYIREQDNTLKQRFEQELAGVRHDLFGATLSDNEWKAFIDAYPQWGNNKNVLLATVQGIRDRKQMEADSLLSTMKDFGVGTGTAKPIGKKGMSSPGISVKPATPPAIKQGQKRSDYARELMQQGYSEEEIMRIVMGG